MDDRQLVQWIGTCTYDLGKYLLDYERGGDDAPLQLAEGAAESARVLVSELRQRSRLSA